MADDVLEAAANRLVENDGTFRTPNENEVAILLLVAPKKAIMATCWIVLMVG
eukprot:CAMPEP_0194048476 /NCGR_PEP_ID=MMETSP0009_2-20130614/27407_1 /TAXON_ID=210454 /ORGANISM="Grammatophora oceanica, Strain CCMP 410" /LENGTH=51 /DNA_ID=CAMNT_0038694341 /DNA_START=96 /DNA_END=247 /DNA_ORIENTATION=-